uniref:Ssu-2 homolog, related sequence 1 n=1 Tax=Labrus bergylta TaxID=56723 RepID=A0A3Q3F390_9LABR
MEWPTPGYFPAAEGGAMFAPPTADFQGPSAPPASMFDNLPGYEETVAGGEGGFLPPPMPSYPVPQPEPGPHQPQWNIPSISKDTARDAFVLFASSKCCYSAAPAKDGVITSMEAFNAYRYRLETFTESRSTKWKHEPYHNQPLDAFAQPPPGPWDIPAKSPTFFVDDKQVIKVPNTSSLKVNHLKHDWRTKKLPCLCGNGEKTFGRGRENCSHCHGQGSEQCITCHGKRQLLVYIKLTVKWTNNTDNCVVGQSSGLQLDNLSKVSGEELFKDTQYMVYPVTGFPDVTVVNTAQRLVGEHQNKFCQSSRILQQRQTIELIPVTKVTYSWKENSHVYFVYGNEFKVSADNYPAPCCCTVM